MTCGLILAAGESAEDAVAGCTAVGMRRCARFGRAPAIYDLTFAFTLWGFLGGAPADLIEARGPLFRAAAHRYKAQRTITDCVTSPGRGGRRSARTSPTMIAPAPKLSCER